MVSCGAPGELDGVKPNRRTAASAWACSLGSTSAPVTVIALVSGYRPPRVPRVGDGRPSTTRTDTGWPWPTGANWVVSFGSGLSCCGLWAQPTRVKLVTVIKPNNRRCNMLFSPESGTNSARSIAVGACDELGDYKHY